MPTRQQQDLPRSLPLLLARREGGRFHQHQRNAVGFGNPRSFVHGVARQFAPQSIVSRPQLLVAPSVSVSNSNYRNSAASIESLHVDRVEQRFVLTGGSDAIVSIYDLSKWGSEEYFAERQTKPKSKSTTTSTSTGYSRRSLPVNRGANNQSHNSKSVHKPIASSHREPPRSLAMMMNDDDDAGIHASIEIPSGHASPISKVQWYPVDTGAFLSSSRDGSLLVWDTESMSPVAHSTPFVDFGDSNNVDRNNKGIGCFHVSPRRTDAVVLASLHDARLKLVDLRTGGGSSHTLLGHANPGIASVQWAPQNDVVLASGGLDGTIRLWDIRKAGSRACLGILNQDISHPPLKARPYKEDYSHLPKPSAAILSSVDDSFAFAAVPSSKINSTSKRSSRSSKLNIKNAKRNTTVVTNQHVAPNNYRPTENSSVVSHDGPVSALSFGSQQDGHSLVSASQDGSLHIWDLRGNGHCLPLRFMAPGQQPAVSRQTKQVPMALTSFGGSSSSVGSSTASSVNAGCCFVGNGSNLLGYSLERGGLPQQVLQGHLHTIAAVDVIEATMQVLTAGKDGMILTWGRPDSISGPTRKRKVDEDSW